MTEVLLHISAGDGPRECQWVVVRLALAFVREAKQKGLAVTPLLDSKDACYAPSCFVKIKGEGALRFANERVGTIRWVGNSPYRPHHKRKNWYVSVTKPPTVTNVLVLEERDIRYQPAKATGPGGQHVNKTESAIRATHIPTGIVVFAQEERSQFANKRIAKVKLAMRLQERHEEEQQSCAQALHITNKSLERGNEIATYEGERFKRR